MKHLLKKLSFSGGGLFSKPKPPKPKPAQLKPPILGSIQLAASFSYVELLDLVSDGPIAGLVNANGLALSSKDILQGIYLDDTAVAVSNDEIVQQAPQLGSSADIKSSALLKTLSQVFKNIQKSNVPTPPFINIARNYKIIDSINKYSKPPVSTPFLTYPFPDYAAFDYIYTDNTDLARRGQKWFFANKNNQFHTLSDSSYWSNFFPPKESVYTNTLIREQLLNLFAIYNDATTNNHENIYLKNIFDNNFGLGWENLDREAVISDFIATVEGVGGDMRYIIKVDPNDTESFLSSSKPIDKNKKYKFSIYDVIDDPIANNNIKIYDLLLPRIDLNGNTVGRAVGCIIVWIHALTDNDQKRSRQALELKTISTTFSIPQSVINALANASYLNLNEILIPSENNDIVQKYNYTNILAEYRSGEEYQAPFKYFNNVLIDKDYSSALIGPFRVRSSVQRIKEQDGMININPQLTTDDIDTEGSADNERLTKLSYSDWDKNINSYDENAIPITHIITNPNVASIFITIQVDALVDTLTKDISSSQDPPRQGFSAGMNFASILNIQVETGSINKKGEEENKITRKFKILALIQSTTFIDIGNPDLNNFSSDDYRFVSEYAQNNEANIFKPFILPEITDNIDKRYVKITKLSAETNSSLLEKECSLAKVTEIIPQNFNYPNSAIIATKLDSRSFGNIPTRVFDCKLKKVRVPSNYYPLLPNGKDKRYYSSELSFNQTQASDKIIYDGDWDGEFKIDPKTQEYLLEWTDNPAWVLLDLITNERYGLGQYMDDSQIDIFDLYKIARFCDSVDDFGYFQGVPDGQGGLEPRFSCNILFAENTKVFDALNVIAALFRGIIYYNNSQINFVDDRPKEPIALFSNTNVKDGIFNYSNYRRDEQFNSIEVAYIDRFENYLTKIEYIEDEEDIRKRGVFKKTINANGVTSRAMARRLGKHLIFQTIKENQSINFSAGLEALLCKPGDLIIVEDELKNLKSNFGKVLSVNAQSGSIRLNEKFINGEFDNKLTVYTPTGYSTNDEILETANLLRSRVNASGFYLNSGNLPPTYYSYLTGHYIFSKYMDGYDGQVESPKQNQYAFYTGIDSKFCYFSTGFTGWVLGTGIPFSDNNAYSKIIFATGDSLFTEINTGTYNIYNTADTNRRSGSAVPTNISAAITGINSLFRDASGSLQPTRGLLDSDITLSSPSQITTFNISGIVQYDYGCEVFVDSSDINYSLIPFVKEGSMYRFQRTLSNDQLYKVISIKEENVNEYSLICTKFDTGKYNLIESDKNIEYQANTYSYTVSQKIGDINYQVLNAPNIQQLTTGLNSSNQFYISGNWKQVSNNKGYNVNIKNSQGVVESQVLPTDQTGAAFYVDGIGNYSFRVNAIGSIPNLNNNNANFYTDSDYSESGIFLIYEEGNLLNYDRPYLSSVTIL
jgi:hypothetical protein